MNSDLQFSSAPLPAGPAEITLDDGGKKTDEKPNAIASKIEEKLLEKRQIY